MVLERPRPGAEGPQPEHFVLLLIHGAALSMECCKLQVRYRADLDLVLKGLSLSIKPNSIFS